MEIRVPQLPHWVEGGIFPSSFAMHRVKLIFYSLKEVDIAVSLFTQFFGFFL